ncbi:hypothetical protein BGY98DRAFT_1175544 [Russula aff. rugulosa BPL654]|nr:hypothetical protein BGY98DRAFT_1175544 [Russula aff. rugulosa BPL654]
MSLACALSLRFATIASNVPISRSDDWRTRAALTPPVQPLWPVVTYCSNISLNRTRGALAVADPNIAAAVRSSQGQGMDRTVWILNVPITVVSDTLWEQSIFGYVREGLPSILPVQRALAPKEGLRKNVLLDSSRTAERQHRMFWWHLSRGESDRIASRAVIFAYPNIHPNGPKLAIIGEEVNATANVVRISLGALLLFNSDACQHGTLEIRRNFITETGS